MIKEREGRGGERGRKGEKEKDERRVTGKREGDEDADGK